jgi:hypothetical protein
MSAKPTHDLAIKTGEYNDSNTGQTKGRWLRIGTVIRHDDGGTSIKLDCVPVGLPAWDGWVSVFPREEQDDFSSEQHQRQSNTQSVQNRNHANGQRKVVQDFDNDVPF